MERSGRLCVRGSSSPLHSFSFKRVRRKRLLECNCVAESLLGCDLEVKNAMRTCRTRARFFRSIFSCAVRSAICGEGDTCACCLRQNATQSENHARNARCDDLARATCRARCSARPFSCFFAPFCYAAELEQQYLCAACPKRAICPWRARS